jgi:hypothetical protein
MGCYSSARYEEDQAPKMAGKIFIFFHCRNVAAALLLMDNFLSGTHDFLKRKLE